jgi:hypothetical protein
MTIERKQFNDAKAPATKHAKKVATKPTKKSTTSDNKPSIKDNHSSVPSKIPMTVSSLFNSERDFESAIKGGSKITKAIIKKLGRIIQKSDSQLKQALLLIYTNEGYKALKCKSFKAYIKKHQTITYDAALKQVMAAKVAYVVNGLDAIGFYSDNSMLAMKDLSDDQIEDVVEQIEKEHGDDVTINGEYTRKMVEAAMRKLSLLDKDGSNEDLDVDDEETEEDAVEQVNDDLDLDDDDDDDKHVAKSKTPTKQSSKVKQTYIEDVVKSESHRQFLEQFKIKAKDSTKIKAIFAAFIETDAGKKPKKVKIAIKLLTKHLKNLKTLEA